MVYGLTHRQLNLLEENIVANVAVIDPQGRPTLYPVWCVLHDGRIYFSTKSDHDKCIYIEKNGNVGLSIVHPKGSIYLSLSGEAEILDRDYPLFDDIMERIIRKYVQDFGKATEFIQKLKNDNSRRLIQITPDDNISDSNHRVKSKRVA